MLIDLLFLMAFPIPVWYFLYPTTLVSKMFYFLEAKSVAESCHFNHEKSLHVFHLIDASYGKPNIV